MSVAYFILASAAAAANSTVHSNVPEQVAIQAVHNFGACVVERTPAGARDVLAMDFTSADYEKRIRAYIRGHDYCIPFNASMSSSGLLLAGGLAEALLKTDIKHNQLAQRLAYDPQRETIRARSETEAMALCTVLKVPEATAKLFDTEPATAEETEAMKPVESALPVCLKRDMKLTVNEPGLRSLLALAAWRIATTPRKAVQ